MIMELKSLWYAMGGRLNQYIRTIEPDVIAVMGQLFVWIKASRMYISKGTNAYICK